MGLQGITKGKTGLQRLHGLEGVTRVKRGYRELQRVTEGNKGL